MLQSYRRKLPRQENSRKKSPFLTIFFPLGWAKKCKKASNALYFRGENVERMRFVKGGDFMANAINENRLDAGLDSEEKNIDRENYVAVWGRLWNPKDEEFSIEIGQGKGIKRFKDGTDAQDYYTNVTHAELAAGQNVDINIELIQYRYGVPRIVKSRILFA